MSDTAKFVSTNEGRHRVAYEMALGMWTETNAGRRPSVEDSEKFLELVERCTNALAYGMG
ncbi:hypothetical protein SM764_04125 [Pseudophaeobacter sp. 1A16562]|uniref:hypothetical protein n=1 Tax=Pseudophaeobacter sp. 1A16562 TaxID=3098143 RepID=UPI0034D6CD1D